jgi:hypothetical protein
VVEEGEDIDNEEDFRIILMQPLLDMWRWSPFPRVLKRQTHNKIIFKMQLLSRMLHKLRREINTHLLVALFIRKEEELEGDDELDAHAAHVVHAV